MTPIAVAHVIDPHDARRAGRAARSADRESIRSRPRCGVRSGCPTRATIAVAVLTIAVVCAAVVMRSSLDGLLGDPAAYGQDWQVRVGSGDGDGSTIAEKLATDPRIEAIDLVAQGGLDVVAAGASRTRVATLGMRSVGGVTSLGILSGQRAGRARRDRHRVPVDA